MTGAALTWLVVNTPAAAIGASATIIPKSLRPDSVLRPAATPANRNPRTTAGSSRTPINYPPRDLLPTSVEGASAQGSRVVCEVKLRGRISDNYFPWQRL